MALSSTTTQKFYCIILFGVGKHTIDAIDIIAEEAKVNQERNLINFNYSFQSFHVFDLFN